MSRGAGIDLERIGLSAEDRASSAVEGALGERATAGAPSATPFVLTGVSRQFDSFPAVHPLNLKIEAGERVAIVGPSGAGKTTLLRLLNTSLFPSSGMLLVLGRNPLALGRKERRSLRSKIGTIYQQLLLVPQVSVLQNVIAGRLGRTPLWKAALSLLSRDETERVREVLGRVGIASKIFERVDRLSGGEQQRVAIARALYQDPEVLLADEPTSSVDPAQSAQVMELLAEVGKGRTLLISTHRLEATMPWITRVIGLRGGQLLFDKSAAELSLDDLSRLYASEKGAPAPKAQRPLSPAVTSAAGAVYVGTSNTPGEFMMPPIVASFVREQPGVRVSLTLKDTAGTLADLLDGRVELAFVGAREPHPRLRYEEFAPDEIILVASPSFQGLPPGSLAAEDAAGLLRVEREEGSGTRAVVEEYFANLGAPLKPAAVALEVGSLVSLKAAVISGIGVAFASRIAVAAELSNGLLRQLTVQSVRIRRQIFAVWRSDLELTPQAKSFLEVARKTFGQPPEALP